MISFCRAKPLTLIVIVFLFFVAGCTVAPPSSPAASFPTLAPTPRTRLILATSVPVASPAPDEPLDFSGYVGGMLLIARDAARGDDWEQVKEELEEAIELTADLRQRAAFNTLLTILNDGRTGDVLAQLEEWAQQVAADSPLASELETAMRFARLNDWTEVEEEINEALDLTTDARLQEALHEMLSDLAAGRHGEVTRDLERLTNGIGDEDPSLPALHAAQEHAHSGDWDAMRQHLQGALDITQDPQHQAIIIEILDDLEKGNSEEAVADLDVLIGSHDGLNPALAELETALRYADSGEWDKAAKDMHEALELSDDAAQQAAIRALLAQLEQGQEAAVRQGLEQLLAQ